MRLQGFQILLGTQFILLIISLNLFIKLLKLTFPFCLSVITIPLIKISDSRIFIYINLKTLININVIII